ncbi:hypothetical protein ON058_00460 [Demequina sp. B12]|uniref:hypothetical protein n=1 Tax=Demequina sp. B12 TaxID=2992757 RepID=UPI00237B7776|nr:hypothetical protein [Demequina sp. B12]MDE0571886.1 hypothetical protein [Demequina sp. B12]
MSDGRDPATEAGAQRRIEELADEFMKWHDADLSVASPEAGSSIALDDAEFSLLSTSQAVQAGLMAARENLLATALLWRSHEGGVLLPSAYGVLVRAAIIGAGNALWLLHPANRSERIRRTAMFAAANFKEATKVQRDALNGASAIGITDPTLLDGQRQNLERAEARTATAHEALTNLGGQDKTGKRPPAFDQTAALGDAAAYAYRGDLGLPVFSNFIWRTTSGDAHGFMWPKALRALQTGELGRARELEGDLIEMRDIHTCTSLFPILAHGALLSRAAEHLYESRRTVPACSLNATVSVA